MSVLHRFHYAFVTLRGHSLAVMLDSLVRVSRRGDEARYLATATFGIRSYKHGYIHCTFAFRLGYISRARA